MDSVNDLLGVTFVLGMIAGGIALARDAWAVLLGPDRSPRDHDVIDLRDD